MTPAELLRREVARDAARPLVTWYDDGVGARVELSVATTANWVAKVAGHLVDEYDVEPGTTVAVPSGSHWVSVVTMLGVWATGAAVSSDAEVSLDVDVDPLGMALSRLVGAQPDDFVTTVPVDPDAPALLLTDRVWSHAELVAAAVHAAAAHHLGAEPRVLSTLSFDTADGLDAGLLVPLAAGGSVVLVARADAGRLQERCQAERVTHTAGADVTGLPRLD